MHPQNRVGAGGCPTWRFRVSVATAAAVLALLLPVTTANVAAAPAAAAVAALEAAIGRADPSLQSVLELNAPTTTADTIIPDGSVPLLSTNAYWSNSYSPPPPSVNTYTQSDLDELTLGPTDDNLSALYAVPGDWTLFRDWSTYQHGSSYQYFMYETQGATPGNFLRLDPG